MEMKNRYPKISRRRFLVMAGAAAGAATLAGTGLSVWLGSPSDQPEIKMISTNYGDAKAMNEKVLVVYASQGGSTAGVADEIGKTLAKSGVPVDVRPAAEIVDLSSYRAVVLGSAIHSGKWMPEAQAFIDRHRSVLRRIPTAAFQVCMMVATGSEQYKQMAEGWLSPVREQIQPVAGATFAGALWPDKYAKISEKLGLRIFLATIKLKAGDYRDWNAIHAWAGGLAGKMQIV